ncbi:unnamed protein product [Symbiodinium sp. CCMP2592]|nr:unnamed protein product [Symbiodinium sp. CCMP2592]
MRRFYFLKSSDLTLQDPPLPTRQEKILFWSHATDVGALFNMLKERNMRPMNAHGVAAFGCNIFYALGHEMSGSDIDEHNLTRVIFNTTRSAKNLAGIVVGGRAWGSLRKHLGGSYETARAATEEDEVLKDANAKAYCVSRNRYCFTCIAFEQLMTPPSTANTLISQYQKAAGIAPQENFTSNGEHMDWILAPGSIGYDVVGIRQWERIKPRRPNMVVSSIDADSSIHADATIHADASILVDTSILTDVATYATTRTPATPATTARVPLPSQFSEDPDHYDTNLVFKATLKRTIEPTAWSRAKGLAGMDIRDVTVAHLCRHGMEEFGLQGLSHGKFTGMILTRNIAESVFLSQLQKKLRENNIDIDATVDALYKSKRQKAPDKVKEAITFVTPLVDTILDAIKPWAQVRNYAAKNTDGDNQAAQRMQALEEQTAKYKQRLRSAGIEVTPQKSLRLQNEPTDGPETTAAPPKRRRLTKGAIKQRNEDILAEPHNVIRTNGQEPPTSMTSIATWVTNLKKSLPREKHAEVDSHIQSVQTILEGAKYTKAELQEMATRWGLPISLTTAPKASPKNLQQLIAAVTYLAVCAVPELYTFEKFSQPCAVYVKLLFPRLNKQAYATATRDASFCYIGSTNITVAKREYNRVAKLRQLQQLKLPKTEIAIRYWNDSQTYQRYSTILLSQHSEYIDAWAEEHSLIQRWQPKLNYPYVTKELVKKAQFWKLLYSISSDTKQEFEASKELRSGKHDAETVTLLYRLANHMDHANAHLMIYCPNIYNQAAYNTWMDKQTFRMLDADPDEIKQNMQNNTPKVVAKHYEIHQLFHNNEHLYPGRHLKFLNHDLVGFFNSIPQSDILQSIHFLTSQFLDEHNSTITVDPHSKIAPAHSGRSTHSLKFNMVKVQAEHIPAIIQFSFDACAFTAIGEVFQQTCGTSMGNQISPILSTCAIVATEITWLRMCGQFVSNAHLHDKFWIRRYVDNRAIIVDEDELQHNPYIQQLASLHFYKKPVQLEDEACDGFLGFRIHADNRQITYNLHREAWRYRLPQSAGSTKLRLSGYHSRKHLIRTIAYPEDVAKRQLQELDDLYGDLGFARLLENSAESRHMQGISNCDDSATFLQFLQFFGSRGHW